MSSLYPNNNKGELSSLKWAFHFPKWVAGCKDTDGLLGVGVAGSIVEAIDVLGHNGGFHMAFVSAFELSIKIFSRNSNDRSDETIIISVESAICVIFTV